VEPRAEEQRFAHRQQREEHIPLGDVVGDAAEVNAGGGNAVEEEQLGRRGRGEAVGEDLEQYF
jgi:hypothetical protein